MVFGEELAVSATICLLVITCLYSSSYIRNILISKAGVGWGPDPIHFCKYFKVQDPWVPCSSLHQIWSRVLIEKQTCGPKASCLILAPTPWAIYQRGNCPAMHCQNILVRALCAVTNLLSLLGTRQSYIFPVVRCDQLPANN